MKKRGEMVVPAISVTTPAKNDAKTYLRQPYARILIPENEGGFFAEVLEFPGCFAEGETPDEAFHNLEGAAESWIESCLEQGQEIPPPSANHSYAGKVALRLPRDLHRLAVHKAERDGVSLNQVLVTAVAAWVGADNLFERIAHKIEMNFIQQNFYKFTVVPGGPVLIPSVFAPGAFVSTSAVPTIGTSPYPYIAATSPMNKEGIVQEQHAWQK